MAQKNRPPQPYLSCWPLQQLLCPPPKTSWIHFLQPQLPKLRLYLVPESQTAACNAACRLSLVSPCPQLLSSASLPFAWPCHLQALIAATGVWSRSPRRSLEQADTSSGQGEDSLGRVLHIGAQSAPRWGVGAQSPCDVWHSVVRSKQKLGLHRVMQAGFVHKVRQAWSLEYPWVRGL